MRVARTDAGSVVYADVGWSLVAYGNDGTDALRHRGVAVLTPDACFNGYSVVLVLNLSELFKGS